MLRQITEGRTPLQGVAFRAAGSGRAQPLLRRTGRQVARLGLVGRGSGRGWTGALVVAALALAVLWERSPRWWPPSLASLVLLVGGYVLTQRALIALFAVVAVTTASTYLRDGPTVPPGSALTLIGTAAFVLVLTRSRMRLGVQATHGESMLVDLRDRLRAHGNIPALPPGWHAEGAVRSAYGAQFAGDFLVVTGGHGEPRLELALVDVSGKG